MKDAKLRALEDRSVAVRDRAEVLNNRVERFVAWLAKLPGRTEAVVTVSPGADDEFDLRWSREGKGWGLHVRRVGQDEWRPLRECALSYKVRVPGALEDLLSAMATAQEATVAKIEKAIVEVDAVFDRLGVPDDLPEPGEPDGNR